MTQGWLAPLAGYGMVPRVAGPPPPGHGMVHRWASRGLRGALPPPLVGMHGRFGDCSALIYTLVTLKVDPGRCSNFQLCNKFGVGEPHE